MKISTSVLKNYIDIPVDSVSLRNIMEDIGLEVKRTDHSNNDDIFTLELLANRGDHHSYVGIAREIHGRTGWKLFEPQALDVSLSELCSKVEVVSNLCLNYTLSEYILTRNGTGSKFEISSFLNKMLDASGINAVASAIDVTNIVNIEIGQPLHVFDADQIIGNIIIRESFSGEMAHLLFQKEPVEIPEGLLVIADESKILAIAGVMGCEEAKVTEHTRRIYLESATFDPVCVRKSSRSLNIQSQSSMRFERGGDPELAIGALGRAKYLFKLMGWNSIGKVEVAKSWDYPRIAIPLSFSKFNDHFDSFYSNEYLIGRLERYEFKCSGNIVENEKYDVYVDVPSYRIWDVKAEEDLFEELARSIGYNEFSAVLPKNSIGIKIDEILKRKYKIEDIIVSQGFYEVFTDGFYGEKNLKNLGIREGHPLFPHVKTINSVDRLYSFMKNNTLSQALDIIQTNQNLKNNNVKVYEWTRTFHPNINAENGLCDEKRVLWAIASGNNIEKNWKNSEIGIDVFYMKGLIEEVFDILDLRIEIKQSKYEYVSPQWTCLHPGRRGGIYHNEKLIGIFGEVHPYVIKSSGLKAIRPCFMELSQDILKLIPDERMYEPPSNYLPVVRDVCLLLPKNVMVGNVIDKIRENSSWIEAVDVTDVFTSVEIDWKDAVTFSIVYSLTMAGKQKLTTEEINAETERITDNVIFYFETIDVFISRRT